LAGSFGIISFPINPGVPRGKGPRAGYSLISEESPCRLWIRTGKVTGSELISGSLTEPQQLKKFEQIIRRPKGPSRLGQKTRGNKFSFPEDSQITPPLLQGGRTPGENFYAGKEFPGFITSSFLQPVS